MTMLLDFKTHNFALKDKVVRRRNICEVPTVVMDAGGIFTTASDDPIFSVCRGIIAGVQNSRN